MSDSHDTEETLKQFRHDPDARVKQSVMSEYEKSLGGGAGLPTVGFWKRSVPLYAAVAALVVMIGVSFVAGQRVSIASDDANTAPPRPVAGVVTVDDIEWSVAERDLL